MINENEKENSAKLKSRVDWIDIAKGIAILLTIVGHSVNSGKYGSIARGLIFSFHMPLFFILSCTTFRFSQNESEFFRKIKKACKHLIMPAIITFAIIIILQCIHDSSLISNREYWIGKLFTVIFSSGVNVGYLETTVNAIGIPWFFFALFIGRAIFDYCHLQIGNDKQLLIVSVLTGMIGIFWGQYQWLPFSMDIALAIQPFFYWGYYLKKCAVEKNYVRKAVIYGLIWLSTLYLAFPDYNNWTYLELAGRRYTLFPICYLTAIAGTVFFSEISVGFSKIKLMAKPLKFVGRNSLYLLCVHILDGLFLKLWSVEGHQFHTAIRRTIVDLAIFIAFILIRDIVLKVVSSENSN